MTAGASMLAMRRKGPPHCRQISMSMVKTRLKRCVQLIARCRSVAAAAPRSAAAAARVPGTICARSGLAGANAPWYRVRCARGFGTNAASRAIRSSGSKITCVVASRYFREARARRMADRLEASGYDVTVGGVAAYSTLGRFDDPILSTMLRWDDIRIVSTLFHELAHQVVYVKDDTAFNESFATAVEEIGIERWLGARGDKGDMTRYRSRKVLQQEIVALVDAARADLETLYASRAGRAVDARLQGGAIRTAGGGRLGSGRGRRTGLRLLVHS